MTARHVLIGALAAAALAGPAAAQTKWGPLDAHSPAADAAAREALGRARVDRLTARVDPLSGLQQQTTGRSEPLAALASDLSGRFPGLNARVEGERLRLALQSDILFDFDKADIRPDAQAVLEAIAKGAASVNRPIEVQGHTDGKGTPAYNQALSERRARAVEAWLRPRVGPAAAQLTAKGFGATRPVAPNTRPDGRDDEAGRQRNRRVEIVIG